MDEKPYADILIVDDEDKMRHILRIILEDAGYSVDEARDGREALGLTEKKHFGVIITDLKMPVISGMDLLKTLKKRNLNYPVVVLTAFGSIESAVDAMNAGALDYITKPFEEDKILFTVKRCFKFYKLTLENRNLLDNLARSFDFSNIIAHSTAMLRILQEASLVSESPETTILITGESGTGKELLAKTIHYNSSRKDKMFLAFNCAALAPGLVESELFGHEKGAFTGAIRRKVGKFEIANGGTVFLDEVADLSLEAQAKVLRVVQERKFERVGGMEEVNVDIRLIAATNQSLKRALEEKRFREDLYYRINVFPIKLPPLSKRKEDIIPLAKHFLKKFGERLKKPKTSLSEDAKNMLLSYHWPGNVRELENAIERAMILSTDGTIDAGRLSFLRFYMAESLEKKVEFELNLKGINLEELERKFVKKALELSDNNQVRAAELLGLTRSKLRSKIKNLKDHED
ncbi:MAG: sigma-54 dependent transcriptional regulator [Thermodesulfobacteriota bacterium]|nr:sigma-54 dependent transcriptional regulator [Thermodesulfobacteriota bacterium]